MTGSASVLGIHPPATVRIDLDGWVQDWPWELVTIGNSEVAIAITVDLSVRNDRLTVERREPGRLVYRYEHAHLRDDGSWLFVGAEDFTVTAGPPQPASVN